MLPTEPEFICEYEITLGFAIDNKSMGFSQF